MINRVEEILANDKTIQGLFIIAVERDGKIVHRRIIKNRIMDTYLNAVADVLVGTAADFEIEYIAVGTDDTAIADTETTLGTEVYRITPSVSPVRTAIGVIKTEFIIGKAAAVTQLEEIGIFCGSTATGTADTGKMLSRILWSYDKTNQDEIYITRYDRIQRG